VELKTQLLSASDYADGYRKFYSSIYSPGSTLQEEIELFRAVVAEQNNQLKSDLERLSPIPEASKSALAGRKAVEMGSPVIFIGHGGSLVSYQLRTFLSDRLDRTCVEFNAEAVCGWPHHDSQALGIA
jgi:hypothetical protein